MKDSTLLDIFEFIQKGIKGTMQEAEIKRTQFMYDELSYI